MFRFSKNFIVQTLTVCLLLFCLAVNSFAGNVADTVKSFTDNDNGIICIAHRGDWHSFPENSVEAVRVAASYDAVSVDLKLTSDKKIVLMADDTVDRMCTDSKGNAVSGKVCDFTYAQLSEFRLRRNNGSSAKHMTTSVVPQLRDVYEEVKGKTVLVLNTDISIFDEVYSEVKALNAQKDVVFRINEKSKDIIAKYNSTDKDICLIGNYQGNIIFLATSSISSFSEAGINTIELGSKNGHGVLYDNFLMKRFGGKLRAMVSMVNGRCGKRNDNETGWDDLISRGYSVIETDYPQELTNYIINTKAAKNRLNTCYDLYGGTDTLPYTTDTEKEFKASLKTAETVIAKASSLSEIENARYNLQNSYARLTVGEKKAVTLSFDFSVGKTIAVVLCLSAFIASQIYLFKKVKKTDRK